MAQNQEKPASTCAIALTPDLGDKLDAACRRMNMSPEGLLEQALRRFLRHEDEGRSVYISAPVSAMMKGLYEENTLISDVKKHGDFGIGTFNDLDGEMILLDGNIYRLKADGCSHSVDDSVETPFACVTFFDPTTVEDIDRELDYAAFKNLLYRLIPSSNMFYAVRIDGAFDYVKVWSVPKQENYRPMQEVTAEKFEYRDVEGTVVGFYTPEFIKNLSMAGYHLHFLTSDRTRGGHLQECKMKRGRIGIQFLTRVELDLPVTIDYLTTSLT